MGLHVKIQKKSELELFFSRFRLITYKKRQIILRADDIPFGVFCIKKGYIRKYIISKEGQELTTAIFKPLDVFPLGWTINNATSKYYYETYTPVEAWRVPKDEFIKYIKINPEAFLKLISRLLNRLSAFSDRMEYLAFGHAQTKIASILIICAERFGRKTRKNILIQLPLKHKDIASFSWFDPRNSEC